MDMTGPCGERGQLHRGVVAGRRWSGGGSCTVIVWRESGSVVVCHEGAAASTAQFTAADAVELARLLTTAAGGRSPEPP